MAAKHTITLPDIGDYKDVPVIELLVAPGDEVKVDDLLVAIESDKATIEVPSPVNGRVSEFIVSVGSKVSMGSPLLVIDIDTELAAVQAKVAAPVPSKEAPAVAAAPASVTVEPAPAPVPLVTANVGGGGHATPSVRQYARELGVDLSAVEATGPKNRILKEDVQGFVKRALAGGAIGATSRGVSEIGIGLPAWPTIDFAKYGEIERKPLSRIQKLSGGNLARNWLKIPHVTNFDHADVSELEDFRKEVNAEKLNADVKLTMVAFLIKASASALKLYPRFNASLDGDDLVFKDYVHIGFAADTPSGLVVPVVRDCDTKGIFQIAREMGEMADKARKGTLAGSEMQGGCFTVSSLGGIGGDGFTPIINAPEVAILGAGRSSMQPVWDGRQFMPRLILPLSLSWDHRVVDGVAAARFLGHISTVLGDFRRALL